MAEISPQLSHEQKGVLHPEYRMSKLTAQSGGSTVTLDTTSEYTTVFELPNQAMNLAESSLGFTLTPSVGGTGNFNYMYNDTVPFSRIEIVTRGGLHLMDLTNAMQFVHSTAKQDMKLEDYESSDATYDIVKPADALTTSVGSKYPDNTAGSKHYDNPSYISVGTVNTATPVISRFIRFKDIHNTILALNKTIMAGEVLLLRFTWTPALHLGWMSTSATDPTAGTAAALAGTVAVSDLALYLAVERNPSAVAKLQSEIASGGVSLLVPYPHVYKTNLSGTSQNVSIRMSRGHGIALERIYHSIYPGTETTNNRLDDFAVAGSTFSTSLNNLRRQEFDITFPLAWQQHRNYLKGHVIGMSYTTYYNNFAWHENFCGPEMHECALNQTVAGLSLDVEQKWDFNLTCPSAVQNHYTFAITQKVLTLSPAGITFQ